MAAFAKNAVMHGANGQVEGRDSIRKIIEQLIELSENTLEVVVHHILANDDHTVVLQTSTAQLGDRRLADRVVYVFHIADDLIQDAYFTGDPRVQEAFYGLSPVPLPE
ncbi:MAG: nuclear transport factor 2 family protein [Actinobacteria bacterium]|nr:MAG: nuclear transport factor 2 family protein [Actinomycetota bacterium]